MANKWKKTGTQLAPTPYNSGGTAITHYLEQTPIGSRPTIFIEAYCHSPADSQFLSETVAKILELLNGD